MARDFVETFHIRTPVYTDPSRRSYVAVGFKHGVLSSLDPRTALRGVAAVRAGFVQGRTMGDAFQQGGAILVTRDGRVPFVHVNAFAGDELKADQLLEAARRHR